MRDKDAWGCVLGGFLFGWILAIGLASAFSTHTRPYKEGQIDALNGKIKYELVEQSDGSIKWKRVKGDDDGE